MRVESLLCLGFKFNESEYNRTENTHFRMVSLESRHFSFDYEVMCVRTVEPEAGHCCGGRDGTVLSD